jgi:hypothetical protein
MPVSFEKMALMAIEPIYPRGLPNSVIELTDESAYHWPVSLFPGQHITGR